MKKALVHDWYYISGGAEKVIKAINNVWDDFDHFALVDFLSEDDRDFILNGKGVKTSFIQKIPTSKNNHRNFLQLFPLAIEQFDLSEYDLIISSSASIAKGVLTNPDQLHICYCHSPMRYAWNLYHQYQKGMGKGIINSWYARKILHKMRLWDVVSSNRVDYFIAKSNTVAKRINKYYNREANVIHPPVDTDEFTLVTSKKDYYFTSSRMVSYKRIDLIIKAFNTLKNKKLIIGGEGPEMQKLKKLANNEIEFVGFLPAESLKKHLQDAKAFIYAAEEDFGIVPVEAQSCGTPVIGYKKGGLSETVVHGVTGILYDNQNVESLINAILEFEKIDFNPKKIRDNALKFSRQRFENEIKKLVEKKYQEFINPNI